MRTFAVRALGEIAIVTKDLKPGRIVAIYQPVVNAIGANLFPMFVSAAVNMIDGQKSKLFLAATIALSAISQHCFCFEPLKVSNADLATRLTFRFSIDARLATMRTKAALYAISVALSCMFC